MSAMTLAGTAFAQQNLVGLLSGSLGPGTYNVIGNIFIAPGSPLTLAPGTEFRFNGDFDFDIYGVITAVGTETDSVKFIQGSGSAWNGMNFHGPATDSSRFEYCVIEGSNCIGVDLDSCSIPFNHCLITNNNSGGG